MKKYIILMVSALAVLTACEKEWDNVPKKEPATRAAIEAEGYTFMPITEFKEQYFYKELPNPGKTIKGVTINDKVALETVVVSSDELGNTYKSLYVQDATSTEAGGLEVKVGKGSMYTVYKPGQKLYIKCDGLILGNYRNSLGLGGPSSDTSYSNGFIDIQTIIDEKLLPGEMVGAEVLVVNSENVGEVVDNYKKYIGRLCRFEGLESTWGTLQVGGYTNFYPSFQDSDDEATKNGEQINDEDKDKGTSNYNKDFADYDLPATWAYSYDNLFFYGSAAFTLGGKPFVVRTSGYSRFALEEIPADGAICDITAILTIYDSTYQLVLNSHEDVVVK